jgi:hypothetical protein
VLDINSRELKAGDTAQLLCEILDVREPGVLVRVLNSEVQLLIGAKRDEALGGLVADPELTLFEPAHEPDRTPAAQLFE